MSFPRYPEYKDSGVEWLGEIPAHWTVIPLGRVATARCDGPFGSGLKSDHYTDVGARVIRLQNIRFGEFDDSDAAFIDLEYALSELAGHDVLPGDVLVAGLGDERHLVGRACVAPAGLGPALVKADCFRFRLDQTRTEPSFVALQLSAGADAEGGRLATGTTRQRIPLSATSARRLALPPVGEQSLIATFLDRETAKIDALIAEQERLIELLKEKRQAVISHAVTKGLDPDVPMKESGGEWLGEVPAHWIVISLGRVAITRCDGPFGSGLKSDHYTDEGARVIRLQNIRFGEFDDSDAAFIDLEYAQTELAGHDVLPGDVLVAGLGDERHLVGRACVAPIGLGPALVKADCFRFRLDQARTEPSFVALQLSAGADAEGGRLATGTTRQRIPLSAMSARRLALPPVGEQRSIARYLDRETTTIDCLADEAQGAIRLLRERRAALVSAAVCGKIDVRELST